jgi:L-2-hydroxyglutarate oxidase LhgO
MARFCVAGKKALYAYCAERGVPHRNCGKLIVATSEAETAMLEGIRRRAAANGVDDIRFLSAAEAIALEPNLTCTAALLSPSTGIVDSHAFMLALQGDAENAGAIFAFRSPVTGGRVVEDGVEIAVGDAEPMALRCRVLVNSAGLHAPDLARSIMGVPSQTIPRAYYAKGNYFTLSGRSPFSRLIYPVPVPGGLGVHLTIDLAGQARFGPDVEWVDRIEYSVDPARCESFYDAVRRYWPGLKDDSLQPGYCGIRPKIVPAEVAKQDFVIQGRAAHGVRGLVSLYGIESPGLTASLAIGDFVCEMAKRA